MAVVFYPFFFFFMTAKKITKPAKTGKKLAPKKITKAKPAKKLAPKKVVKKSPAPKKSMAKKVSKPVKTAVKKKPAPKKVAKKPVAKKVVAKKKVSQPAKKVVAKKAPKVAKKEKAPKVKAVKAPKAPKVEKAIKAKKVKEPKVSKRDVVMTTVIHSARVEKPTHGALYVRSGRHFFTEDRSIVDMPELIAAQINSYSSFVDHGIQDALESIFPISDFSEERVEIHFKGMELEEPRYSPKECRRKNLNYESYLRVKLQMLNKETGEIKEDTVFMGGIPLMTAK